jgi:hypothetical protein
MACALSTLDLSPRIHSECDGLHICRGIPVQLKSSVRRTI